MLAREIAAYEKNFHQNGVDGAGKHYELRPLTVPIIGDTEELTVIRAKLANGDQSFYYQEKPVKNSIVLHFTAGFLKGDMAQLTKPDYHVSVPFVIGRDGTILNLWSSSYWSYHLGRNAIGGNKKGSQETIGIEISNIGPLKRSGDILLTSYENGKPYCGVDEEQYYQNVSYRDYDYYATFTSAQYESTVSLLRYLTAKFSIPRQFLPKHMRFDTTSEVVNFNGIVSHANYRHDKFDIGPAFDWDRVLQGVIG